MTGNRVRGPVRREERGHRMGGGIRKGRGSQKLGAVYLVFSLALTSPPRLSATTRREVCCQIPSFHSLDTGACRAETGPWHSVGHNHTGDFPGFLTPGSLQSLVPLPAAPSPCVAGTLSLEMQTVHGPCHLWPTSSTEGPGSSTAPTPNDALLSFLCFPGLPSLLGYPFHQVVRGLTRHMHY